MKIGAQFYTVRDFCKDLDGFAETLKKIADIGYKTVQISGTCAFEPEWLKAQLDSNGLECVITHTAADKNMWIEINSAASDLMRKKIISILTIFCEYIIR